MNNQTVTVTLGRVVATPGALDALTTAGITAIQLLRRHHCGDWGDITASDKRLNNRAAKNGDERVLSAYTLSTGVRIWVVTEADRSSTCLLLPEEY